MYVDFEDLGIVTRLEMGVGYFTQSCGCSPRGAKLPNPCYTINSGENVSYMVSIYLSNKSILSMWYCIIVKFSVQICFVYERSLAELLLLVVVF